MSDVNDVVERLIALRDAFRPAPGAGPQTVGLEGYRALVTGNTLAAIYDACALINTLASRLAQAEQSLAAREAECRVKAVALAALEQRVKELEVSLTNAIQQLDDDMEYAELRADLSQVQDESALSELTNAKQFRAIRELLGYVEDGSGETVTISQDDVTREWCVSVGKKNYYEPCLRQALDAALSPRHQSAEGAEGEGT